MPNIEPNPGPEVPPLAPGLPHTPIEHCQMLLAAVALQGLSDDDLDYVLSPTFLHHLMYAGLDPDVALRVKVAYLRDEIDLKRLAWTRDTREVPETTADWQGWRD